jgi:hypothetical protein
MVDAWQAGCDVVYGVRADRDSDSFFKRSSARGYYGLLRAAGAEVVSDHADFRLLSRRALDSLRDFREVNLFLRGLVPLLGYPSTCVYYRRGERAGGVSKYPMGKCCCWPSRV